jgi:hypothetical protein
LNKSLFRKLLPRVLKAVAKTVIVLVVFLVISQFFAPLEQIFPQAKTLIETYVMVYVAFVIAGELTKGTIYQFGLSMGKAFFFIGYTIYALNSGIITQTIQSITFSVNLEIFLIMVIFIGTLDFAKSLLQIINCMADKAETQAIVIIPVEQEIPAQ